MEALIREDQIENIPPLPFLKIVSVTHPDMKKPFYKAVWSQGSYKAAFEILTGLKEPGKRKSRAKVIRLETYIKQMSA